MREREREKRKQREKERETNLDTRTHIRLLHIPPFGPFGLGIELYSSASSAQDITLSLVRVYNFSLRVHVHGPHLCSFVQYMPLC